MTVNNGKGNRNRRWSKGFGGHWISVALCAGLMSGPAIVAGQTERDGGGAASTMPATQPLVIEAPDVLPQASAPQTQPSTAPAVAAKRATALPTLAEVASTQPVIALVPPPAPPRVVPAFIDTPIAAITEQKSTRTELSVLVNKSVVLTTKTAYKRLSIGSPDVADVNLLSPTNDTGSISYNLLLTGKKPGTTQVIIWDDNDHAQVMDVNVQIDVAGLQDQLKTLFPTVALQVRAIGNSVAIQGHVPSLAVADQVLQVAKPYSPSILDLMEVSGGQEVMLSVKIAEVSRVASSALGVNFGFSDSHSFLGSSIGQVSPMGVTPGLNGAGGLTTATPNPAVTLFGQAMFGKETLAYFIEAMRENNLLRMLAEPNVMAISGQEASFLAGGEYPVPVASGTTGGISIDYREYGVKLKFVPVVLGDGRVRLKVSPEVSDLDYANAVKLEGVVIPGLTQRKVSTTVELADGQSFAIAGLLNNSVAADSQAVPLLGNLPILGPLFRSVRYARKETELVILVTPHLVEPLNPVHTETPLPGEKWRTPSEAELFWKGDLGAPANADPAHRPTLSGGNPGEVPMFHGSYGFNAVPAKDEKKTDVANAGF